MSSRVALVTGGARRIGEATVRRLAGLGWSVALSYRTSGDAAAALVAELEADGAEVIALAADLDRESDRRHLIERTLARLGRLDALVNNAATFPHTPIEEVDEDSLVAAFRTDAAAPALLALAARHELGRRRGAVVNILDVHVRHPLRNRLAYLMAKSALAGATRALALELAPAVRVNAVAPGAAVFPPEWDERTRRAWIDATPGGAPVGADAIAHAVCTLIEADGVTGQTVAVDGGLTLSVLASPSG